MKRGLKFKRRVNQISDEERIRVHKGEFIRVQMKRGLEFIRRDNLYLNIARISE